MAATIVKRPLPEVFASLHGPALRGNPGGSESLAQQGVKLGAQGARHLTHHPSLGQRAAPFSQGDERVDHARKMTARALAHAMLAGPRFEAALAARMAACLDLSLGERPLWLAALARAMVRVPGEVWRRLDVQALGERVEAHEGFREAWTGEHRPDACRWLLRSPEALASPPAGLERPHWPTVGALARGLGLTPAGLWRLTLPPDWQRHWPSSTTTRS